MCFLPSEDARPKNPKFSDPNLQPRPKICLKTGNTQQAKKGSTQPHLAKPAAKRAPSSGAKRKKRI